MPARLMGGEDDGSDAFHFWVRRTAFKADRARTTRKRPRVKGGRLRRGGMIEHFATAVEWLWSCHVLNVVCPCWFHEKVSVS